jgi:hypothetical protein
MEGDLVPEPKKRTSGFYDFGRYTAAADDADLHSKRYNDLWRRDRGSTNSTIAEVESREGSDTAGQEVRVPTNGETKATRQARQRKQTDDQDGREKSQVRRR